MIKIGIGIGVAGIVLSLAGYPQHAALASCLLFGIAVASLGDEE